jgi:hypothetical protein
MMDPVLDNDLMTHLINNQGIAALQCKMGGIVELAAGHDTLPPPCHK